MVSINDLLGVALKIEGVGYSFYTKLAERTSDEIKNMFERLALQEKQHVEIFKRMLKKYEGKELGNDWEDTAGYLKSYAEISIFPRLNSEEVPANFKEALDMAMEVEKDSIIFYSDLARYLPSEKIAMDEVIDEERKHLKDLIGLYGN